MRLSVKGESRMNIYLKELKSNRKALIAWAVCIVALIAMSVMKYRSMYEGNAEIGQIMSELPRIFAVLVGISNNVDFSTAKGFISLLFTYPAYILIFHAGFLGAHVLSREEEEKTAEFLYAKPVSRNRVLLLKLTAAFTMCIVLNMVTAGTFLLLLGADNGGELVPFILANSGTNLLLQLIYLSVGALSASLCKQPARAGTISGLVMFGTLLLAKGLAMADNYNVLWMLAPPAYFEPRYYMFEKGIPTLAFVLSVAIILAAGILVFTCYRKRDLKT